MVPALFGMEVNMQDNPKSKQRLLIVTSLTTALTLKESCNNFKQFVI
jgi:hypothetical protein